MGKGDKRSKRGKIIKGTFGKTRLHKKKQAAPASAAAGKAAKTGKKAKTEEKEP